MSTLLDGKIKKSSTRLISSLKRGVLFLSLFISGAAVSGFYFNQDSKSGLAVTGFPELKSQGYTVVYDSRSKTPLWTKEHLTRKNLQKLAKRSDMHFVENPNVYPAHRSTLNDYYSSGYDRGHMVPAADQQFDQNALRDTFYLTNICPQNAQLNRGYWNKLEQHARSLAIENPSVDVVSGPLFIPTNGQMSYPVIGKNNVWVPTHFYKVIAVNQKETTTITAYIVPNQPISPGTSIETYQVSIQEIESVTGLQFQPVNAPKKSMTAKIKDSI